MPPRVWHSVSVRPAQTTARFPLFLPSRTAQHQYVHPATGAGRLVPAPAGHSCNTIYRQPLPAAPNVFCSVNTYRLPAPILGSLPCLYNSCTSAVMFSQLQYIFTVQMETPHFTPLLITRSSISESGTETSLYLKLSSSFSNSCSFASLFCQNLNKAENLLQHY